MIRRCAALAPCWARNFGVRHTALKIPNSIGAAPLGCPGRYHSGGKSATCSSIAGPETPPSPWGRNTPLTRDGDQEGHMDTIADHLLARLGDDNPGLVAADQAWSWNEVVE